MKEQELRDRGIGKTIQPRIYGWDEKKRVYHDEGVWESFRKLRSSLCPIITDADGYVDNGLANRIAQLQIDTYLIHRSKGKDVTVPRVYGYIPPQDSKKPEKTEMYDMEEFKTRVKTKVDLVRDWSWVYDHLDISGLEPKDAPSPGAWGQLKWVRKNEKNREDFMTKILPKIVPPKSAMEDLGKFDDDSRTHFELLERLQAEAADEPGEVPAL